MDAPELCRSLQAAAEERGAQFVFQSAVTGIARAGAGYELDAQRDRYDAEIIVNSAGLYADDIARLSGVDKYPIHPCRGDYFSMRARGRTGGPARLPGPQEGRPRHRHPPHTGPQQFLGNVFFFFFLCAWFSYVLLNIPVVGTSDGPFCL